MRVPLSLVFIILALASYVSAAPTGPMSFNIARGGGGVEEGQSLSPYTASQSFPSSSPPYSSPLLLPRGRITDKIRGTYQVASMFLPRITGKFSRKDAVGVMKHVGKKAGRAGKGVVSFAAGKVIRTMGGRRYARVRRRRLDAAEGEIGGERERGAQVYTM
jgi:hypothetical protein